MLTSFCHKVPGFIAYLELSQRIILEAQRNNFHLLLRRLLDQ